MIIDFRESESGRVFEADVCIIGAGAAGITIAREFAGQNLTVCLVESGGLTFDSRTQEFYEVENVGLPRHPPIFSRLRFFGGTTNHWDGRCAPLDEIDFMQREWVPYSGWPITRSELDPYYERAHAVCELGAYVYDDRIMDEFDIPRLDLDPSVLSMYFWQFSSPTRFGGAYREQLERSQNVRVLLNANAINIQANQNSSFIEHVDLAALDGKRAMLKAKRYILCCGAIENARLLLASNDVAPHGIGNGNDIVGRFFMEHIRCTEIVAATSDPYAIQRVFSTYKGERGYFLSGFSASQEAQKKDGLLNTAGIAYSQSDRLSATNAASRLARDLASGRMPDEMAGDVWAVLSDLDEIFINVRRRFLRPGSLPLAKGATVLLCESEQAPNPDSRISLSNEKDSLGKNRAKIDWRFLELDRRSVLGAVNLFAAELGRSGVARLRIPDWMTSDLQEWSLNFKDVAHHIGTTRMSRSPAMGVVDENCRVHGVDNLYVAGSSVFPTSGHVNPTLTIVALALRLADHLRATKV